MLEKFFKLKENKTTVRTEIIAGITTFMTMAYILAVNPDILSVTGMDKNAVFTATALSAVVATLVMALCPGARNGLKRLLRLYRSIGHGTQLGVCTHRRLSRRHHLFAPYRL